MLVLFDIIIENRKCLFMEPIHIVTDKENISELVLMPGDPLRAKYIADNFLEESRLVNEVRNMLGFTGTYKGKKITVIGSGMGIPSMGIYAYELAHFYKVKKIIRIGSAGAMDESINVRDIVVATEAKSVSSYALAYANDESDTQYANESLLEDIKSVQKSSSVLHFGPVITGDVFDVYSGNEEWSLKKLGNPHVLASEMEAFGLYFIGKITGIKTAAIVTITNSKYKAKDDLTAEERQNSLDEMITLALEAITK